MSDIIFMKLSWKLCCWETCWCVAHFHPPAITLFWWVPRLTFFRTNQWSRARNSGVVPRYFSSQAYWRDHFPYRILQHRRKWKGTLSKLQSVWGQRKAPNMESRQEIHDRILLEVSCHVILCLGECSEYCHFKTHFWEWFVEWNLV